MTLILIAVIAQVVIGIIVANEIGSERRIGRNWSLALCLLTPFLFGLVLTLISPKKSGNEVKWEKNGTQRAIEGSLVVISILSCILVFNYNSLAGIALSISTAILILYVAGEKYISLYDIIQSILIICFAICCVFALVHYLFGD